MATNLEQEFYTSEKPAAQLLQNSGIYVFTGEVNTESVRPIIEWILVENHVRQVKKRKELLLMICSEGGEIEAAFALIDVMLTSAIPIKTIGLGQIASSGLMIFLAGQKGRRVLTPNTSILSHQFSWGADGKSHELFAQVKEFELIKQRMVDHYKKATGLDDAQIRESLLPPTDMWLSANEALALNICDYVSDLSIR